MSRPDQHSYFDNSQPRMAHLDLRLSFPEHCFGEHSIQATATITFDRVGEVDLDTRDLKIHRVESITGATIPYTIGEPDTILGSKLTFVLPRGAPRVKITYATSPSASGLQWLTPAQTAEGTHSFVYSQAQCLHARSFVPCQDSPGVRFTYSGTLFIPKEMRGLMAAIHIARTEHVDFAEERWEMGKPIPAYLIAFAVGRLESRDLSARCRVWAEPSIIDSAADELNPLPTIMDKAEELFGPYRWDRYDVLIMPPAFPFGGMENQGLTFLNPSVLAGDGSMLSVVAHELAHSWTGNLVTNATWTDFWLNEGWTTWAEGRISEAAFGLAIADLDRWLMQADWLRDHERFMAEGRPQLTCLAWDLSGIDPDDAFSRVPYARGSTFLTLLEREVGRERFDAFVRIYIHAFGFSSINTDEFLEFIGEEFRIPDALKAIDYQSWVYGKGILPANMPEIASPLVEAAQHYAREAAIPSPSMAEEWHPLQWAIYLEAFPRPALPEHFAALEQRFRLFTHGNMDVRAGMAVLCAESGASDYVDAIGAILAATGRSKYLRPIYRALGKNQATRDFALSTFESLRGTYHPIVVSTLVKDLDIE